MENITIKDIVRDTYHVNAKDIVEGSHLTLTLKVHNMREWRIRSKVAIFILEIAIRFAGWLIWSEGKMELVEEEE